MPGVELAARSRVKHLCLFHHEPTYDDQTLAGIEEDSRNYAGIFGQADDLKVSMAYDGLELDL